MMIYIILFTAGATAWLISTVVAGGAATLLIPIIGLLLGAHFVAPVITLASIIANPSRIWLFKENIHWPVIVFLLPGSILGASLGAWSLTEIKPQLLQVILGLFLIGYVALNTFVKHSFSFHMRREWFLPLGITVSYLSGLVGATGPVLNPFLLNYGLEKEHLVATKSVNSLIMQLTKLTTYTLFGAMTLQIGLYGLSLGVGAVCGVILAKRHLLTINNYQFRIYTLILMASCGVILLLKGLR